MTIYGYEYHHIRSGPVPSSLTLLLKACAYNVRKAPIRDLLISMHKTRDFEWQTAHTKGCQENRCVCIATYFIWNCFSKSMTFYHFGKSFSAWKGPRSCPAPKCYGMYIIVHIDSVHQLGVAPTDSVNAPIFCQPAIVTQISKPNSSIFPGIISFLFSRSSLCRFPHLFLLNSIQIIIWMWTITFRRWLGPLKCAMINEIVYTLNSFCRTSKLASSTSRIACIHSTLLLLNLTLLYFSPHSLCTASVRWFVILWHHTLTPHLFYFALWHVVLLPSSTSS